MIMSIILSITGVFKTVLILLGVFVLLRFIGQLMVAKRNLAESQQLKRQDEALSKARKYVEKNSGKTTIIPPKNRTAEDVDFEEV